MDKVSKEHRSWNMSRIRSKNMKPELIVRRLVHSMGYRYRLHRKDLPGKPDLVFSSRKKVIFLHGCFWHQHPDSKCQIVRFPRSGISYWLPKLQKNIARDHEVQKTLQERGWHVLVVWECETKDEPNNLRNRLRAFLQEEEPR